MTRVHVPLPPAWDNAGGDHDAQIFDWLDKLPWHDDEPKPYHMLSDCTTVVFHRREDAIAFKLKFRLEDATDQPG